MNKLKQIIIVFSIFALGLTQAAQALTLQEILQGYDSQQGQVLGASTLVLDPSTPAAVKSNSQTLTTASFTPPAGSVLYVLVGINSNSSNKINSVSGGGLTFTKVTSYGTEMGNDAVAYLYTAVVGSSQSMTISAVQQQSTGSGTYALLKVLVVTGANTSSPVGALGGARGITGTINNTYTSTSDNSWGWMLTADWAQKGVPTPGTSQSVYDSYNISGEDTYAIVQRSVPTVTAGTSVTLNTTAPTSGAQISQLYFEMMPAQTGTNPPPTDTTAPTVPTNLSATAVSSTSVNLSWTASTDNTAVTGYKIYRNGSLLTTANSTLTIYSDSGLSASTSYSYTVAAFDAAGNTSAESIGASATTQANAGGSIVLVDCSSSAIVQTALTNAVDGATVKCSSAGSYTWTAVTIPSNKNIILDGNGATVVLNGILTVGSNTTYRTRITNFMFSKSSSQANSRPYNGVIVTGDGFTNAPWRIDHNTFSGSTVLLDIGTGPGLMDHNNFPSLQVAQEGIHILGPGTSGWTDDHVPGSTNAFYFEDNTVTGAQGNSTSAMQAYYGARTVARHNTFNGAMIDQHGTAGMVGARWWEFYGNTFNNSGLICLRAGSGVIFGNTNAANVAMQEEDSGYPASYQIGRGINQSLYPAYVWGNGSTPLYLNSTNTCAPGAANMVQLNRDVYTPSSGAVLPSSCSVDQAFVKTDEGGNWDTSNGTANDGLLYKCTATNTWAKYYTPFIYPYPLTAAGMPNPSGGSTPPADTTAPTVPTGLSATAVSSSGINLSWSASSDAVGVTGYKVYRNGSLLTTTNSTATTYSDTGLSASTSYSYTVAAYDAAGNTSAQSSSASATTQAAGSGGGNWYVRSGAGGNGTSWASAWSDVTGIVWSSIQPGDTIWIAGGNYGALSVGKSGNADTNAGRIFIKRATTATHGSDTGWSAGYDAQVSLSSIYWASLNVGSYVTIDGQVDSGIKVVHGNSDSSSSVSFDRGVSYVTLRYLDLQGPGDVNGFHHLGDDRGIDVTAWNGSSYDAVNYLKVQYSRIHGACTQIWNMNASNGIWEYNQIYNSTDSSGVPCHPNIFVSAGSNNVTIRYNKIYNYDAEGIMILNGNHGSMYVYGNLWYSGQTYARILESQNGVNGPVYFYNNTIDNMWGGVLISNGGTWASGSEGKNNIWINMGGGGMPTESNNLTGSVSGIFANYSAKDYHLISSASSAINKGISLTSDGYINKDMDGNTRGADGTWDIGAFEYTGSFTPPPDTTAPTVPTNLSATGISVSSISLSWTASTDAVGVTGYRIYRAGTQIGTSATNSYTDTGLTVGTSYSYTVSAYDAAGNVSVQTSSVSGTTLSNPDTTAPTVSILNPSSGSFTGNITFSATASDPSVAGQTLSGLKTLTLYIDGSTYATSSSGSISKTLDTTTLTNASHTLTAQATDNAGNNSTIASVTITVNNAPATKYPRTITLTSLEGLSAIPNNQSITVSILSGSTVLETQNLTPNASKQYTVTFLSSDPQLVDIRVKVNNYLSAKLSSIDTTINSPSSLTVNPLLAGDINNDNTINSLDYSSLNSNWLKTTSTGDMNNDGIVNSFDFAILKNNYNKVGQ